MCGSTNLVKQDGLYVCENCGTKYSVEEAKKLLVEVSGTVKIDDTDELKKLYQVARTARDNQNNELASTYYSSILVKDPFSWEATFYSYVCSAYTKKKGEALSQITTLQNTVTTTANLICDSDMTEDEKYSALYEVATHTCALTETLALAQYELTWIGHKHESSIGDGVINQTDRLIPQAFPAPAVALSNVIEAKCEKSKRFVELKTALRFPVSSVGSHECMSFGLYNGATTPNGGLKAGFALAKQDFKPVPKGDGTYGMPYIPLTPEQETANRRAYILIGVLWGLVILGAILLFRVL